jgi:hypothetical protein
MEIRNLLAELRGGNHELFPPASEDDLALTESSLGRDLPRSYRTFVTEFSNGAYLYGVEQVNSTGKGTSWSVEEILAYTETLESVKPIPIQDLVLMGQSDDGSFNEVDPETPISSDSGDADVRWGDLVPFHADHNANSWCFLAGGAPGPDAEYPVAYVDVHGLKLYGVQPHFTAWLARVVEHQTEVIGSLYPRRFLESELGLG